MNQENKLELTQKIKKLQQIIKGLESLENNQIADTISCLLKLITDTFEDVEQRLVNQETPVFRNNSSKDDEQKLGKGAIDYEYRRNKILSFRWKCLKCERPLLSSTKNGFNWLKNTITDKDECFCDDCFIKVKKKKNYSEYEQ